MKMLYHYTSLNGILGILESNKIWATHVSFLNDVSEFWHGLNISKKLTTEVLIKDQYLADFGRSMLHRLETGTTNNLYVASFSKKADLLSLWRGYCPTGAGISLGFDLANLSEICEAKGYRLAECNYEHGQQLKQVGDRFMAGLKRSPNLWARRDYEKLDSDERLIDEIENILQTTEIFSEICELAPLFKNEGFHEESEWRIISNNTQAQPVKYCSKSSYFAPYIELEILSALREVIVGPNPNQRRCELSIKLLLESKNHSDVKVTTSKLPFNSW